MTLEAAARDAALVAKGPMHAGAQANIAIPGKFLREDAAGCTATRDWQLYFFFRVLSQTEADRIPKAAASDSKLDGREDLEGRSSTPLHVELLNPGLFSLPKLGDATNARGVQKLNESPRANQPASRQFRDWLKLLTGLSSNPGESPLHVLFEQRTASAIPAAAASGAAAAQPASASSATSFGAPGDHVAEAVHGLATIGNTYKDQPSSIAVPATGSSVIEQGLVAVILYEFMRQGWRAQHSDGSGIVAAARPMDLEKAIKSALAELSSPFDLHFDPASINLAFTFNGLDALQLDPRVLKSFPDVFRDGMAARAERLADTGASAPEHWYGELGSSRIHGYFTGGFATGDTKEEHWKKLRRQIDLFNTRKPEATELRLALQLVFGLLGMELMHIELGQAPYDVRGGVAKPKLPRIEHFGYRDGISQPFVDMKIGEDGRMPSPPSGGGAPGRNRTWRPLAAGEVYLGFPDEDGNRVRQPANSTLRDAGTYVVFRKLAQDVVGFRNFLKAQRPGSQAEQELLGAQLVGRWKSGASLVVAPDVDLWTDDERMNDFVYADDDPRGEKCPLGAHVRRSNPRDIGGRDEVRRHRLMRRSMAYGGSILPEDSKGDSEERGLLFIAANARIDMQFEVIQGDWLNRGEFLGQAGLGKCPLTGSNSGGTQDAFLEAGKTTPVTGLPRFVTLRGGDYFFVPSILALKGLARAERFETDNDDIVDGGHTFGDGRTEELFSEARLTPLSLAVALGGPEGKRAVGFRIPEARFGQTDADTDKPTESPLASTDVVFVRSHDDVTAVLKSVPEPGKPIIYTAAHSRIAGHRMIGRGNLLVGTDWGHATADERQLLFDILKEAWGADPAYWRYRLTHLVDRSLRDATERVARSGRIDLVRDFAADATFRVVTELFGVVAPGHLTELAMALPFSRRNVGAVHPDWLAAQTGRADDNPGLVTLRIWSFLVGLNLIADYKLQKPIIALGQQAAAESLLHIDGLIARARERVPTTADPTLLSRFIAVEKDFLARRPKVSQAQYYDCVRSLVFELALTASAIIPAAFGGLMDASFRFGLDLSMMVPLVDEATRQRIAYEQATNPGKPPTTRPDDGVTHLIYEINRLSPALPLVMRLCEQSGSPPLPSGAYIRSHQWVAALISGANLDGDYFPDPLSFSLHGTLPIGAPRPRDKYLMFGVQDAAPATPAARTCWGRDKVALFTLVNCVRAASKLPGLRRVPGPSGELKRTFGITSGLVARFGSFTPS